MIWAWLHQQTKFVVASYLPINCTSTNIATHKSNWLNSTRAILLLLLRVVQFLQHFKKQMMLVTAQCRFDLILKKLKLSWEMQSIVNYTVIQFGGNQEK